VRGTGIDDKNIEDEVIEISDEENRNETREHSLNSRVYKMLCRRRTNKTDQDNPGLISLPERRYGSRRRNRAQPKPSSPISSLPSESEQEQKSLTAVLGKACCVGGTSGNSQQASNLHSFPTHEMLDDHQQDPETLANKRLTKKMRFGSPVTTRSPKTTTAPLPPPQPSVPDELLCPITLCIMQDPVLAMDGHTYERAAIEDWLCRSRASPRTGAPLITELLIPNHAVRAMIAGLAQ
jgi:hypothetical protein